MKSIKLSELNGLNQEQIAEKLLPLIEASFSPPSQENIEAFRVKLEEFEKKHGMSYEEMYHQVCVVGIPEPDDFAEWAMDHSLYQSLINYRENL